MKISFNEMATPFFISCIVLNFICSLLGFFNVLFSFLFANIFLFLAVFFIYIFREPTMHPIEGISSVVSPCDGKIQSISFENSMTIITAQCGILDKFIKYSPMEGEVINVIFFSKDHSQFGGGLEIEICDKDGFKVIVIFYSDHWINNQYKIQSFVTVGQNVDKGTPLTFIPFCCTVKIVLYGSSNIMTRMGKNLHAGFSHLIIKELF